MYAPERQQQILAAARADGRVDVSALADDLDVTPETVRRDLTALERHGLAAPGARRRDPGRAARLRARRRRPRGPARRARRSGSPRPRSTSCPTAARSSSTPAPPPSASPSCCPTDRELTVVTHALPVAMRAGHAARTSRCTCVGGTRPRAHARRGRRLGRARARRRPRRRRVPRHQRHHRRARADHPRPRRGRRQAGARRRRPAHRRARRPHQDRPRRLRARGRRSSAVDTIITDSGVEPELADEIEAAGPRVVRA